MNKHHDSNDSPKRKPSEMISEIGATFISAGKTLTERQNRLTAVCSDWNIIVDPKRWTTQATCIC